MKIIIPLYTISRMRDKVLVLEHTSAYRLTIGGKRAQFLIPLNWKSRFDTAKPCEGWYEHNMGEP